MYFLAAMYRQKPFLFVHVHALNVPTRLVIKGTTQVSITLSIALFYPSVPVSHDNVTVSQHEPRTLKLKPLNRIQPRFISLFHFFPYGLMFECLLWKKVYWHFCAFLIVLNTMFYKDHVQTHSKILSKIITSDLWVLTTPIALISAYMNVGRLLIHAGLCAKTNGKG